MEKGPLGKFREEKKRLGLARLEFCRSNGLKTVDVVDFVDFVDFLWMGMGPPARQGYEWYLPTQQPSTRPGHKSTTTAFPFSFGRSAFVP